MEPDLRFDSDFDSRLRPKHSRWWPWPIRAIWLLMVMIAVSILSMTVMARGTRRQPRPATLVTTWSAPQKPAFTPKAKPGAVSPAKVAPAPRADRFVVEADAGIDPKMVVKADPKIDPEMVFNPEARGRQSLPIAPGAGPVPGDPSVPKDACSGPDEIDRYGRIPQPR